MSRVGDRRRRGAGSLVESLLALALLLVLLAGVPLLLLQLADWPITGLPTGEQIRELPETAVTDEALFGVLTVAAWGAWALFACSVVVEVVARARGRVARVNVGGPLQRLAARLVGSLLLSLGTVGVPVLVPALSGPGQPATGEQAVSVRLPDGQEGVVLVRAAEAGQVMPDAQASQDVVPDVVAGQAAPAGPTAPGQAAPAQPGTSTVTVQPGDHFWGLAKSALTQSWGRVPSDSEMVGYWLDLVEANRHLLAPPHDPDLIYPDQVFTLPPLPADPLGPAAPAPDPTSPAPPPEQQPDVVPDQTTPPPPEQDQDQAGTPDGGTGTSAPEGQTPTTSPDEQTPDSRPDETGTTDPEGQSPDSSPDGQDRGSPGAPGDQVPDTSPDEQGPVDNPSGGHTPEDMVPDEGAPTENPENPAESPDTTDGTGQADESPETTDETGQSRDEGGRSDQSPDTTDETGQSPDGTGRPDQSPDTTDETGQSPDGTGRPDQSPDTTDETGQPDESPDTTDGTGQSPDGTGRPDESPDTTDETGQPTDGTTETTDATGERPPDESPDGTGQQPDGTTDTTDETGQPADQTGDQGDQSPDQTGGDEQATGDTGGESPDSTDGTGPGAGADTPGGSGGSPTGGRDTRSGEVDGQPTANAQEQDEDEGSSPLLLLAGGVMVGGALLAMDRLRRAQQRYRTPGKRIRMPAESLVAAEQTFRQAADVDGARLIDLALRAAAGRSEAMGLPALRWVEATDDTVTLVLGAPVAPPPGFEWEGRDRWVTSSSVDELAALAANMDAPTPALVPMGTTDDEAELLVDLESNGVTEVVGDPREAAGVLRSLALAAATSPWVDDSRVWLVGITGELTTYPGVTVCTSLGEALAEAESQRNRVTDALRGLRCQTTREARAVSANPSRWSPLIVISAVPPASDEERDRLERLGERTDCGVAIVVPASGDPAVTSGRITVRDGGQLHVSGVEPEVRAHQLDDDEVAVVSSLLHVATDREPVDPEPDEGPARRIPVRRTAPAYGTDPAEPTGSRASARRPPVAADAGLDLDEEVAGRASTHRAPGGPRLDLDDEVPVGPSRRRPAGSGAGLDDEVGGLRPASRPRPGGRSVTDPLTAPAPGAAVVPTGELLASAEDLSTVASSAAARNPTGGLAALMADVDVVVRVLGDVEVVRRAGESWDETRRLEVSRPKVLEVITYLAMRDTAVEREDLEISLFPDGTSAPKTAYNLVSTARKILGDDLFPPSDGRRYRLTDRVVTDYALFYELTAQADETDDDGTRAELLAESLDLVMGEPFTGAGRGFAWVGPHRGIIVAQVIDAAEELAEIHLASGNWRAAEWAARKGLRAFPTDERMYRILMRAASTSGNVSGVHRVYRELLQVIADPDVGVAPEDSVHPETVTLLEELTGTRHAS